MAAWSVTLPITGIARMEVVADTEEDAIEMALNFVTRDDIEEWEALETVSEGNCLYAMEPWSAEAEEVK